MIKHYYNGEPLTKFCRQEKIHEGSILVPMDRYGLSVDEAVDYYLKHKTTKASKYSINGKSVKSLLKDFKLYQKFCHKLYRSKDKNIERIYNEIISQK